MYVFIKSHNLYFLLTKKKKKRHTYYKNNKHFINLQIYIYNFYNGETISFI